MPLQPDAITTIKTKGQTFTSPYEEEAAAMESALSWSLTNANHHSITILFYTDSKSSCEALISSHPRTFPIHNSINSISSSIPIQWIPGHPVRPPGPDNREATSAWAPSRVLRVACHSTWACSGARKEDPGQP